MEELSEKPTLLQTVLKFGLIYALSNIAIRLLFHMFIPSLEANWMVGLLTAAVNVLVLFFGMQSRRVDVQNGFMTYGEAFTMGLFISLAAALVLSVFEFIYMKFIDPDAMKKIYDTTREKMLDKDMSEEDIERSLSMLRMMQKPGVLLFSTFFGGFFFGFILSLIVAIFARKENPDGAYNSLDS